MIIDQTSRQPSFQRGKSHSNTLALLPNKIFSCKYLQDHCNLQENSCILQPGIFLHLVTCNFEILVTCNFCKTFQKLVFCQILHNKGVFILIKDSNARIFVKISFSYCTFFITLLSCLCKHAISHHF